MVDLNTLMYIKEIKLITKNLHTPPGLNALHVNFTKQLRGKLPVLQKLM